MRTLHTLPRFALIAAAIFVATRSASAALYGNFVGPNVTYQNVSENDSQITGPPVVNSTPTGLFGAPLLIPTGSDDLTFSDLGFSSLAADGTFELQDGKLTFNIVPTTPSAFIHSLSFDEGGAYRVDGPTGDASSEATLLFNDVRITSVNGATLANPIIVSPTFNESQVSQTGSPGVSFASGDVKLTSTGGDATGTWDISAAFNFDAALASAAVSGRITGISVALNNELLTQTTSTDGLTLATMDKKHFIVTPVTTSVPEPASLALLLGGSLLLARRRIAAN
jgi:hypothetical protein